MEYFYILVEVLKIIGISLGVGGSTIAIALYLGSLSNDGVIDASEKRMLGFVYMVLRIAMVLIFVTHLILNIPMFINGDVLAFMSPLNYIQWLMLAVLYINAILMTMQIMPDTYGPGIQMATWYTLGVITTLATMVTLNVPIVIGTYVIFAIFAIWLIDVFKRDLCDIQSREGMLH